MHKEECKLFKAARVQPGVRFLDFLCFVLWFACAARGDLSSLDGLRVCSSCVLGADGLLVQPRVSFS